MSFWPLGELGGILVGAGLLGVAWDYFDGRDRERRDDARVRRLLKEAAPDFRDAVVEGFAVNPDGEKKKIRRSARKTGQTYSVNLGDEVVRAGRPVRIRHVYRTITPRSGHRLYLAVAQPAKGLSIALDYTETDIARVAVTDLISSARRASITQMPEQTAAREISFDVPGWVLPGSAITYVWTLYGEEPGSEADEVELPAAA